MIPFRNELMLALVWVAISGSYSIPNLAFGFVIGWIVLFLVREQLQTTKVVIRPIALLLLIALFIKELVLSAFKVAKLVLSPRMDIKPGIFAYPLKVDRDFEITLLANLITLTPGTLSVDVSDDRRTLFVHGMDCSDPDQARRDISQGFERRILEAFR
ncbi:multicomponent Na+:H+ antiporter subunit E [Aminobacter lissarensis]|uniref:Multicomponent Na+:H+ antiporter subunit E n=1 Tax=Aminobacter carboxidus TaxID=376165 RepID=A0A8E1WGH8_9HYPH|nr:Na+/H+ antiporter subunit E [Aminobacter lissarensis]MBB6466902.1 multicomponent Na+:H+ antiporter subunit E [Aminobacter lissarensis]